MDLQTAWSAKCMIEPCSRQGGVVSQEPVTAQHAAERLEAQGWVYTPFGYICPDCDRVAREYMAGDVGAIDR